LRLPKKEFLNERLVQKWSDRFYVNFR
jgi:hypothetical protein